MPPIKELILNLDEVTTTPKRPRAPNGSGRVWNPYRGGRPTKRKPLARTSYTEDEYEEEVVVIQSPVAGTDSRPIKQE
ncbi:hypothetical protein LTR66_015216, partial [Elasticomyces elasticus]